MKLLDFVFWGSIKQKLKIKRVKLAIKKMQSKNDKALKKYQDKKAYYEQNYPPNSMSAIKPMLYAVYTNYQDLFLSKQDCLEALKYLGYKNPTFLGIYIKKEQIIVDRNTCSRAFFKFQLTPELNALIPIANDLIFIIENKYDDTVVNYTIQDTSCDATEFNTIFICKKDRLTKNYEGVQLKFEITYPNIILQSLNSSFSPSYPWDPEKNYSFFPREDENKIKNLLYAYYHAYYSKEYDLVQDLPNYYSIEA